MEEKFNHFDEHGNAIMVDVSEKRETERIAVASGKIRVNQGVMDAIVNGTAKKGDVLGVARVAGIMGVKQTSSLIPMCHPLLISKCTVDFEVDQEEGIIKVICTVKICGKTGVEMEALTGVQVTLLTIYDMCKAMDRGMEMFDIHLEHKDGGKSGVYRRQEKKCPIFAVSGIKNSGKTTFLEGIIPLFVEKGLKIGVIKHDGHTFEPDVRGTDSDRLRRVGAEAVAVYCDTHYMLVEKKNVDYEKLAKQFQDVDLVLVEGAKNSKLPKIEIVRRECSEQMVCDRETVIAVATDSFLEFGAEKIGIGDYEEAVRLILAHVRERDE